VLAALPIAIASVAGFFGAWSWGLDLAAAFRPQYAVVLAVASLLAGILGRRGGAFLLALVALLNAALVAPLWFPARAPAPQSSTIKLHYHNVHGGGDERFVQVAGQLVTSDADLVFFSEVSPRWMELFAASDLPYSVLYPLRLQDHRRIMVVSRIPVTSVAPVELVQGSRTGGIAVDLALDGRPLRVIGLHTHSPRTAQLSGIRDAELKAAGEWAALQELPVVMIGDLNSTPWSHPFRDLIRTSELRNSQRGFGIQPSWMVGTGPLMVPIDHALHAPALTTTRRELGPSLGSAHHSLIVEFAWAEPAGS